MSSAPDSSWQARTGLVLGGAALEALGRATVAVFGLGGVGSYAAEALARAGVGHLVLIDGDVYQPSNLNRQLGALTSTLGQSKARVMAARALDINPAVRVEAIEAYYHPDRAEDFPFEGWDYIIDAVDMVTAKIDLACRATALGVPMISVMGTGYKLDASRFRVGPLDKTKNCPLARVMRRELGLRGIRRLPVVWSDELPMRPEHQRERGEAPGSLPYVPPVAGMLAAGHVITALCAPAGPQGEEQQ